jgi:hypothetical protein
VCCHSSFECVVTHLFECVVTLVTDRLDSSFLYGTKFYKCKNFFLNISAQSQLLEVEGPGDVGIVKPELCYILCFALSLLFSHISLIAIFL